MSMPLAHRIYNVLRRSALLLSGVVWRSLDRKMQSEQYHSRDCLQAYKAGRGDQVLWHDLLHKEHCVTFYKRQKTRLALVALMLLLLIVKPFSPLFLSHLRLSVFSVRFILPRDIYKRPFMPLIGY